jgi:hypothetical protein
MALSPIPNEVLLSIWNLMSTVVNVHIPIIILIWGLHHNHPLSFAYSILHIFLLASPDFPKFFQRLLNHRSGSHKNYTTLGTTFLFSQFLVTVTTWMTHFKRKDICLILRRGCQCRSSKSGICCVAQAVLKLQILLPLPSRCLDYRCTSPHQAVERTYLTHSIRTMNHALPPSLFSGLVVSQNIMVEGHGRAELLICWWPRSREQDIEGPRTSYHPQWHTS